MHEPKELETVTIFTVPNSYFGINTTYRPEDILTCESRRRE